MLGMSSYKTRPPRRQARSDPQEFFGAGSTFLLTAVCFDCLVACSCWFSWLMTAPFGGTFLEKMSSPSGWWSEASARAATVVSLQASRTNTQQAKRLSYRRAACSSARHGASSTGPAKRFAQRFSSGDRLVQTMLHHLLLKTFFRGMGHRTVLSINRRWQQTEQQQSDQQRHHKSIEE